jgi:hypothetical protein
MLIKQDISNLQNSQVKMNFLEHKKLNETRSVNRKIRFPTNKEKWAEKIQAKFSARFIIHL